MHTIEKGELDSVFGLNGRVDQGIKAILED